MLDLLALVPLLPLAGFIVLAVWRSLPHKAVAAVGAGSVGASMVLAILVALDFMTAPPAGHAYAQVVWQWVALSGFSAAIAFHLDALSAIMMLVVTIVSFLILLYSARFMADEEGYGRFFAYMNLFVASMLVLVLAANLLLLYLGWEGVGLCSYLLIGFWYKDSANGRAAMKAFIVTRVGDAALMVALFVIYFGLGTLNIQELSHRAPAVWAAGSPIACAAAALILGGAVGKSAQIPLQTWLPDAMAGPTPVSALIHAATMVTAGVYLIARMNALFLLAPVVQLLVAIVGAVTLVVAGFSATSQTDFKRTLAYSTISQIGYMFLGLGVGAWSAAIFHFVTHAFFKSLLFLAAGVVIMALRNEHDMFKMGGLRKALPVAFWTFLAGCVSMAAVPPVTAGFFSKDWILDSAWAFPHGGPILWAAGILGVFLTSTYTFRMLFLVFFGDMKQKPSVMPTALMTVPLVILAVAAICVGWFQTPRALGGIHAFSDLLSTSLPPAGQGRAGAGSMQTLLIAVSQAAALAGLAMAYILVLAGPLWGSIVAFTPLGRALRRLWLAGWGFDWVYDRLIVQPFVWGARINRGDFLDLIWRGVAVVTMVGHMIVRGTQNGRVRWYAAAMAVGGIVVLAFVVMR